jgi:hypothetical protein
LYSAAVAMKPSKAPILWRQASGVMRRHGLVVERQVLVAQVEHLELDVTPGGGRLDDPADWDVGEAVRSGAAHDEADFQHAVTPISLVTKGNQG